jgi:predicted MarR family transcription regulator
MKKLVLTKYIARCLGLTPERLKLFLTDLEEKGKISILSKDNIRLGQKTYIITQSGKNTVLNYLDVRNKNIIDVFEPRKPAVIEDLKRFWGWVTGIYPTHRTE